MRVRPSVCGSYVSVVVVEAPEQLLSEGVQAGRHREGHHAAPTVGVSLGAPLLQLVRLARLARSSLQAQCGGSLCEAGGLQGVLVERRGVRLCSVYQYL